MRVPPLVHQSPEVVADEPQSVACRGRVQTCGQDDVAKRVSTMSQRGSCRCLSPVRHPCQLTHAVQNPSWELIARLSALCRERWRGGGTDYARGRMFWFERKRLVGS